MKRSILLPSLLSVGLLLTACGGDGDAVTAPPDPSVVTTTDGVVDTTTDTTTTSADGELRAPTPIEAVSGSASGQAAAESAEAVPTVAADDAATSDMRIAPFVAEYVLSDDMLALPTADVGYVFDSAAEPTPEQVAQVAGALGVDGEPVLDEQEYGSNWRVGPDDGSAPAVWVYDDAQQSWSYSGAWATEMAMDSCAVSVDASGTESNDCLPAQPPEGVPTSAEAEQQARQAMAALGVDAGALTFDVYADEWSANVSIDDRTAEHPAMRYWNFGYGGAGILQYASGTLATPLPVGPYPLVDLETAFARLQDMNTGVVPMAIDDAPIAIDVAPDAAPPSSDPATVAPDTAAPDTVVTDTIGGDDSVMVDPPVDVPVDREAMTVTLVDVQPDLWWVWDADNTLWLVPAYRFVDTDGGWHTVPAVTDEFLIETAPPTTAIPIDGDGGIGDGAEPLPVDSGDQATVDDDALDAPTVTDPDAAIALLDDFVGLSIEEFTAEAKVLGYDTRVVQQDGEALAVTEDYSASRVNVAVEGPRVVAIKSMG